MSSGLRGLALALPRYPSCCRRWSPLFFYSYAMRLLMLASSEQATKDESSGLGEEVQGASRMSGKDEPIVLAVPD